MSNFQICKFSLFTVFFLIFLRTEAVSQCSISDLVVTNSDCDENDNFSIELDFNFNETGMNGFQVLGNGNNYGVFQYEELPITITGLIGNCQTEFEFIVRDVIDPTCAAFLNYGTVCCDDVCSISVIDFATTECDVNLTFGISLNISYEFVGNSGFNVDINEEDYGNYDYEALPLNIADITTSLDGFNTIVICDNESPECCTTFTFLNPCVCGMTNITSTIINCDNSDTTYYTLIDFEHVATNDSFQMGYSNGGSNIFLGTFSYNDLPVTAGPILLSDKAQEILIVDTDDFFCFSSAYLGIVDDCQIECQLFNLFAEPSICEEGEYFMDIEFEGKDLEGSTFDIIIDGTNYGTFEYGENFYTVGPIPSNCDLAPTVIIQDSQIETCSDFFNLSEPVCCLPECNFISFETTTECGPEMLTINGSFENNGTMLSTFYFVQFLGTSYGPFLYGDFTFSIQVPLLPNGEYDITINDSNDPECQISSTFIAQCDEEPCIIFDVLGEASECEDNLFFVDLEFLYAGEVSDSFYISGNGINYGSFAYGDPFYTVGPLEGDCETIFEFVINDQVQEDCNSIFTFDAPICCLDSCNISALEIIDFNCNDELDITSLTLNFIYENVNSAMFIVSINGISIGSFEYSDLPITINEEFSNVFELTIQDSENVECTITEGFELNCSEDNCSISEVVTEFIECNEDKSGYFISLTFTHENTSIGFDLLTEGNIYGSYDYADLPITVGPLSIDTEYNFVVADSEFENCSEEFLYYIEQCETSLKDDDIKNIDVFQSNNTIQISNNGTEILDISVFNTTGFLMQKMRLSNSSIKTIDTATWSSGIYLIHIASSISQKTLKVVVF